MALSGSSISGIKSLFARSGNQRAFPRCRAAMVVNEILTGEICHIKGARPGSACIDPNQTETDRHGYANLVLMRPTRHTVIDDDEEAYSVKHLRTVKTAHESQTAMVQSDWQAITG